MIPTNNDMLIDELKHDVERERWIAAWQQYRVFILGAITLIILATAAQSWWRYHQMERNMALTDQLYSVVTPDAKSKPDEAAAALSSFAAANPGTPAAFMAEMQAAGLELYSDNKDGAAAHLQAALAMKGIDDNLRAVTTLQYAHVVLDTATPADLQAKLQPYTDAKSPYRFQAWELMALLAQRQGDMVKAQEYAGKIVDDNDAPLSARNRAQNLQRVLK